MPGRLSVCGCLSLPLTGDDLAIPAVFGAVLRFAVSIAAAVLLVLSLAQSECEVETIDVVFLASALGVSTISGVLYVILFHVSSQGSILQWRKRNQRVVPVVHMLTVTYLAELALVVLGIITVVQPSCSTGSLLVKIEMAVVVAIFVDFVVLATVVGTLLYISGGKRPSHLTEQSSDRLARGLFLGFARLTCGVLGVPEVSGERSDFAWGEIARVMRLFFKDLLVDFTLSDVLAGVILLRAEQKALEQARVAQVMASVLRDDRVSPFSSSSSSSFAMKKIRMKNQSVTSAEPISASDAQAIQDLREFDEFAPYMMGIYGWIFLFYSNPLTFLFRIPFNWMQKLVYGDVVEHYVFRSVIKADDSRKRKILYSSFTSYLGEAIPYTITVDHERRAVVIALRGTISIPDIGTDLMCRPARLDAAAREWGVKDGEKHFAHGGMLRIANRIRADVEKQQILHRLFRVAPVASDDGDKRTSEIISLEDRRSFLRAMGKDDGDDEVLPEDLMFGREVFIGARELDKMDCSDYRLICCGHSLGACMATILSLLLRPRFPQVRCLAYSSVSAIFSRELAEESEAFVASCTLGKDFFGRLNWHSAKKTRDQLLDVIRRSKASKSAILLSLVRPRRLDDLLYSPDEVPYDSDREDLKARLETLSKLEEHELDQTRMFMPGRIIYLEKTHTETTSNGCGVIQQNRAKYVATRLRDREQIQDVQITSRCILDHLPDYLMIKLRQALDRELTDYFNEKKHRLVVGSEPSQSGLPPQRVEV